MPYTDEDTKKNNNKTIRNYKYNGRGNKNG
jgi:hypothetical protein